MGSHNVRCRGSHKSDDPKKGLPVEILETRELESEGGCEGLIGVRLVNRLS